MKKNIFSLLSVLAALPLSAAARTQQLPQITPGISSLSDFIQSALAIIIKIGVPAGTIFIIYSGFLFVTAQGNESQITKAKKTFLWTCIGLGVLLGAWAIASAIKGTISQLQ